MTLHDFAYRISGLVAAQETLFQRQLGADWTTAYAEGWAIMDETYEAVIQPERSVTYLGLRTITGKGSHGL